jgi:pimeloyl-ACP methyl ester carboxylesterase
MMVSISFAISLLTIACGCGYEKHPRMDGAAVPAPASPPRWPRNYTQLPEQTGRFEIHVEDPAADLPTLFLSFRGTPVGGGWISYTSVDNVEALPAPSVFRYHAWREAPPEPTHSPDSGQLSKFYAFGASAPFRMGFRVWIPPQGNPKGLVVHQWGLGGPKFEQPIVDELVRHGWAVIAYNGLYWSRPGALALAGTTPRALGGLPERDINANRSPSPPVSDAEIAAAVEAGAQLAAAEYDDAIGQYVLAHEAALEFVRKHYPQIPTHPLVLIGCSFGSLMTPALATRLGSQVDACVLVGSGSNFLRIAGEAWQDYFYSRARTGRGDDLKMPARRRERMYEAYLESATLDPFHTAVALRSVPTLMLHANWDGIVPAKTGEALWEQAGRPERWTGSFGHIFMFFELSRQAKEIVAWVEAHAATRP